MFPSKPVRALLLASMLLVVGCSTHPALKGRVVEAGNGSMEFVSIQDGDPGMIVGRGVTGARIEIVRDPKGLNRKVVARGSSRQDGTFEIPIEAFGAGWMEEEWLFRCTHPNYQMVEFVDALPGGGSSRVLRIDIGQPGPAGSGGGRIDEAERIRRELERYGG
ncbi:MAG: hypothetical protein MK082_02635 [Phycisphaerales bacterium]|nr:hypothetical protein [Phycisphaerales bacterium]